MVVLFKRMSRVIHAALLALFLSACTVVPGLQVSSADLAGGDRVGLVDKFIRSDSVSTDFTQQVNTRLISPALLSEMRPVKPQAQANPGLQVQMDQYSYVVGVGDFLNIIVWDHPELTIPAGQFRSAGESGSVVHPDGTIFYPYIGKVKVVGKLVSDARDLIARDLANYIESPQVEVNAYLPDFFTQSDVTFGARIGSVNRKYGL